MRQNVLLFVFMVLVSVGLKAQYTVQGVVFEDENANGIFDLGEAGVVGVAVTLINDATGTPALAPINTALGGNFSFTNNVPSGTYHIRFNYNSVNPNYKVTTQDVSGATTQATDVDDDSDADLAAPHATHVFTVDAGTPLEDKIGMGIFLPANIDGEVWEDLNGDGLDGGEPNTPVNVDVSLLDAATLTLVVNDASGNPLTNPISTNGTYSFNNITPGDYIVEFSEPGGPYPGGLHLTKVDEAGTPSSQVGDVANDSDADPNSGQTFQITLTSDLTVSGIDAGYWVPGQVGDLVWEDLNGNGIQDGGEPGLGGIQVELLFSTGGTALDANGNPYPAQVTGGAGDYLFDEIPPGNYKIAFEVNPGGTFYFTKKDAGGDAVDSDADVATGETATFIIQSGDPEDLDIDAGYYQKCTIGNITWHDLNGNGIQDGGEPDIDVDIEITDVSTGGNPLFEVDGTTPFDGTITSSGGNYLFDNLPPGTYKLTFTAPTDYFITLQNVGSGATDSDPDRVTGMTVNLTCNSGDEIDDIDAGFFTKCVISDFTWEDLDGDGAQGGEPGLGGVQIEIIDVSTGAPPVLKADGTPYISTNINSNGGGNYIFDDLPPGEYKLTFTAPSPTFFLTEPDAASDDKDSDADVMTGMTINITCNSDDFIDNVDAGFFEAGSIEGLAWHDSNGDGIEGGEPLLDGVTFQLINTTGPTLDVFGNPVPNQVSAGGFYNFSNLRPGTYTMTATIGGWTATTPNVTGAPNDNPDGSDDSDFDAGGNLINDIVLRSSDNVQDRDAGFWMGIKLSGTVWGEEDNNSMFLGPPNDNVIPNVQLIAINSATGVQYGPVTTDAMGVYMFNDLPPGDYIVQVVETNFSTGGQLVGLETCDGSSGDDDVDNDDNGSGPNTGPIVTSTLQLYCGLEPEGAFMTENSTVDFCFKANCNLPNPLAAFSCENADTICDLAILLNFCSRMPTSITSPPIPVCPNAPNTQFHNTSWFAFVAGTGTYTMTFNIEQCAGAGGQAGVYTDCTLSEAVVCEGNCIVGPFEVESSALIPGNVYFFFLDGCNGSVCSYNVDITGNYSVFQIPDIVDIECSSSFGRCDTICPNNTVSFRATDSFDDLKATYVWQVTSPSGVVTEIETDENTLDFLFTELGDYTITLADIYAKCSNPVDPFTITVTVANPADEDFGIWPVCENLLDAGWLGPNFVWNTNISDPNGDGYSGWLAGDITKPGTITRDVVTLNGCEFKQSVEVVKLLNSPPFKLDTFLCPGEFLEVGPVTYNIEVWPAEQVFLTNAVGCDSLVNVIVLYLGVEGEVVDVGCVTGGYQIQFNQGPNPFIPAAYNNFFFEYEYIWKDENGNIIDDGDPDNDPRTLLVPASGTYTLTVVQSFENSMCMIDMAPITVDLTGLAPQQVTQATPWGTLLCEDNATFTYTMQTTVPAGDILKYIWTYPNGTTVIGPKDTANITINWAGTMGGKLCASIQTVCGISPPLCDTIDIVPVPVAALPAIPKVCVDSLASITASGTSLAGFQYNWNFDGGTLVTNPPVGAGPHLVSWGDPGIKDVDLTIGIQACVSNLANTQVEVVAPVPAPIIDCSGSLGQIQFTWPTPAGATGLYDVQVVNGPSGVLNGNTYTVTVPANQTVQVDIILTSFTNSPCGSLVSLSGCSSQDCIPPSVDIEPVADICLTANTQPINLTTIINGTTGGTSVFSGPGITDPSNGVFDPKQANLGPNTITLQYVDPNNCKDNASRIINVYETPTADFIVDKAVICQDSFVVVEYNGSITSGGSYNWTFGNDVMTPGNGTGPFNIKWTNPGNKTINLTATKNGCVSQPYQLDVEVDPRVPPVSIECIDQKATEITVGWNSIANINDYTLLINGTPVTTTTNLTYNLTGLTPNDVVFFELRANSNNACPSTKDTITCIAELCPPIIIDFSVGDTTICLDADAKPFQVDALISGGLGTGTGVKTWSGRGINADGLYDPVAAGPSTGQGHKITLTFVEGTCDESASLFVKILAQPKSTFTAQDTICVLDNLDITYSGTPGQPLDWKTPPGVTITQQSATRYTTKFASEGVYTLGLVVGNANCLSELSEHVVKVDPELDLVDISCATTLSSVQFTWTDIDCASQYQVVANGVSIGTQSNLSYLASGLAEGQKILLEITPISDCACPATKVTIECEARACPPVVLALSTPQDKFCVGDVTAAFQLVAKANGSVGTGTGVWSGTGVNAQGLFNPQGLVAGVYTLKYKFTEENCDFEESIDITIYGNPSVTVTTTSPDCYLDNFGAANQVTTGGDGSYTYRLDGNAIQLSDLDRIAPGSHILVVNDGKGCDASTNFTIGSATEPSIQVSGQAEIIKGQATSLSVSNGPIVGQIDSIVWTNQAGEVLCAAPTCKVINVTPDESDTYCARIYYNGGCYIEDCFSLIVRPLIEIILPNIIKTDGGSNANFFIQSYANIDKVRSLKIFDRWGNLVYSRSEYKPAPGDSGWDGKINGTDVVPGVYAYTIDVLLNDGKDLKINGDVTVVR